MGAGFIQMFSAWGMSWPQAVQQAICPGRDWGNSAPRRAWWLTIQGLSGAFHCIGFLESPGHMLVPRLHF